MTVSSEEFSERYYTSDQKKKVHIIGGGTVSHISSHLALCAPAYGGTARYLMHLFKDYANNGKTSLEPILHLTRMAGLSHPSCFQWSPKQPETNNDVAGLIANLNRDLSTKIVIMNAAMCDYDYYPEADAKIKSETAFKYARRYSTRENPEMTLNVKVATKVVGNIREKRKDIFAVAFKATCGATPQDMFLAGLNLLKESSVNLVLANDVCSHMNMIITPEEAAYHETKDRSEALNGLVEMSILRSHLTFTKSTVVDGQPIPWNSELVPTTLRTVVDYCIEKGAYKPFRGATVGHFACKINDNTFLTSIRKSNFNDISTKGLVKIVTDGPDSVLAYGAKPSVGGQSQRIVFSNNKDYDCIVHFHTEIKSDSKVPQVSQREVECGSHQCGNQTSNGLKKFGNLSAVYLQNHGPNIVFNRSIDPQEVINFIEENFDLSTKTGGYSVSLS